MCDVAEDAERNNFAGQTEGRREERGEREIEYASGAASQ
jgi:hypothetical protein